MLTFYVIQRVLAPVILEEDDVSDQEEEEDEEQITSKLFHPPLKTANNSTANSFSTATSMSESDSHSFAKNSKVLQLATSASLESKKASTTNNIASSLTFTEARRFESDASIKTGSISGSNKNEDKVEYRIEVLETPLVIQCESYRSTQHFYNHIKEQVMRFYTEGANELCNISSNSIIIFFNTDELDEVLNNGGWESNLHPFTLRLEKKL